MVPIINKNNQVVGEHNGYTLSLKKNFPVPSEKGLKCFFFVIDFSTPTCIMKMLMIVTGSFNQLFA